MLELVWVPRRHGNDASVHVQLANDGHAALKLEIFSEVLGKAKKQSSTNVKVYSD